MIILHKLTYGNDFEKEQESKKIYKSIVKKIDENYWISKTKKERNTIWKSNDLELVLNIDNEKSINLVYVPNVFKNLKSDFINKKTNKLKPVNSINKEKKFENNFNVDNELQELREKMAKAIEKYIANSKFDIVVSSKNKNLYFNFYKKFYDPNPGNSTLTRFIDNLSFDIFKRATDKEDIFKTVTEMYEDVIFEFDFTFTRGGNFNQKRKLKNSSLLKLSFPVSEPRFKRLLEK